MVLKFHLFDKKITSTEVNSEASKTGLSVFTGLFAVDQLVIE